MSNSIKGLSVCAMLAASIGLVGCGGDSDNDNVAYNGNTGNDGVAATVLKYNIFHREYGQNTSAITNIVRNEITFSNTGITDAYKGLISPYIAKASEGYDFEIGDHYLEKHLDDNLNFAKDIQVSKPDANTYQVNYTTYGENNLKTARSLTFKEIDISGTFDFAKKESQGFYTWVNHERFNRLPTVVTFPTGSSCFAFEKQNQDKITYGFEEANVTEYTNLDSYLMNEYGVMTATIKKYSVGLNNESQVVEYRTTNSEGTHYAVLYNGKVYENAYKNDLVEIENTDITKGEVDCEPLNTVAADYIEQELLKAYK